MKPLGTILVASLAAVGLLLSASAARADLVAYYPMDGSADDLAGGFNGTLFGGAVFVPSPSGLAVDLNGVDQYIDTTTADNLGLGGNFTASAWILPDVTGGDRSIFGIDTGGTNRQLHLILRGDTAHMGFYANDTPGNQTINPGQWQFVTFRFNNGEQAIFVDGQLDASSGGHANLITDQPGAVKIGRWGGGNYFDGLIDEVTVYNEALALNQIAHLAARGDPTALPGPPAVMTSDFTAPSADLDGWVVLNGGAHRRDGDGGGITPSGGADGFAQDGGHPILLMQSPQFTMTGQTIDGTNALIVTFAGGAGDQDNQGMIFNNPGSAVGYNGGNSNNVGQKGLAFYNVATGQYDATIFEADNGGTNTRAFTPGDLSAMGVNLAGTYRLQYFENDDGGWGWGQLNSVQLAADEAPRPAVYTANFADFDMLGWTVLNGRAFFRGDDGGGITPGDSAGGFAHDSPHETFLLQSPEFQLTGDTVDGTNALIVTFAGGAGDQDGQGVIFNTPGEVVAYNGGDSNSGGQKGLAFYNVATGQYDATIFENDNGNTNTRMVTLADLTAQGVDPSATYRLQYFENDDGGWGWGQLSSVHVAAGTLPAGPPPEGGEGFFGIREVKFNGTIGSLADADASLQSRAGVVYDGTAPMINFFDTDGGGSTGEIGGDVPYLSNRLGTNDNDFVQYAQGTIRVENPGDYTFYARGDDGFRLRIVGQTFTGVSDTGDGTATINGDVLENGALGGNVNGFGVINLAAGDYKVEYTFFDRAGGAYNELFAAPGVKTAFDSDFAPVGQQEHTDLRTAGTILNQPNGFDVVMIYDGANNLDAAIQDVEDYWNSGIGANVFTATAATINYEDPDNDGGGHGAPKLPFPGEQPGTDDNNFALGARGQLEITDPGTYTFMVYGDDGSRFRLLGTDAFTWDTAGGSSPQAIADGFRLNGCCADGFGIVRDLDAGTYPVELIWNEIGGGAYVGLWAAFGEHTAFDANVFQLLGENIREETFFPAGLQLVAPTSGTAVPEPATYLLLALGGLGLLCWRRRRPRD